MEKEIFNKNNTLKVVISLREDHLYDVELFRWTNDIDPESGYETGCFWEMVIWLSVTDTLENAEKIASEELGN